MAKDRTDAPKPDATNIDALPQSQRDFIDLNNEYAGRETGRVKRFLTAQDEQRLETDRKNRNVSALLRLLDDPVYAGAYYTLQNLTERIDDAIDIVLATNAERISEAKSKLQRLKDTAAELPDGRKMFRSSDGRVYAEDGTEVKDPALASAAPASPAWEELVKAREELLGLSTERRDIEQYRYGILAETKDWLTDEDNPRSLDELKQRTAELKEAMPPSVSAAIAIPERAAMPTAQSAAEDFLDDAALNAPALTGTFNTAHDHASAASPIRSSSRDSVPGAKR